MRYAIPSFFFASVAFVGMLPTALPTYADSSQRAVSTFSLAVSSSTFENGARMPLSSVYAGHGCNGRNISPELRWSHAPSSTQSFALTVHDPDARAPGGWWHWVRFNIPARVHELGAGDRKTGTDGTSSFGELGYGGPCPPAGSGVHHYHFTLYALDLARLPATPQTDGPGLTQLVRRHTLETGTIVGTYSR